MEVRIIAAANQKGGVGKTTTVVNMATALADEGRRVLVVDFDSQANTCISFGADPDKLAATIYDVLIGKEKIEDIILHTKYGVDIVPSNNDLSQFDLAVIGNSEVFTRPAHVLKDAIGSIQENYDFIFIDLPPSLGLLVVNGLTAATEVLIPMQCEYLATSGVKKLLSTISNVQKSYNPQLKILGVIATMFDSRTNLSSVILQAARKEFDMMNIKIFDTTIHRCIKFGESPMLGEPAIIYSQNPHIQNYRTLVEEVLNTYGK